VKYLLTLQIEGESEMSANGQSHCPRSCAASNSVCFVPKLSELHKKPCRGLAKYQENSDTIDYKAERRRDEKRVSELEEQIPNYKLPKTEFLGRQYGRTVQLLQEAYEAWLLYH
jgi:hypothetical protein